MDEKKLEVCLFSKWNHTISNIQAKKEVISLLSHRGPTRLYNDLRKRKLCGGDSNVPWDTFIITCALFCRGRDSDEEIVLAIKESGMEQALFIGTELFLKGDNKRFSFSIKWSDGSFPNLHTWFSRFAGQFRDEAYREVFSVARLLNKLDSDKLVGILEKDTNDIILLNWLDIFFELPPNEIMHHFLTASQSKRRQALAFWWKCFSVDMTSGQDGTASALLAELSVVPEQILFTRIYEYSLAEQSCPRAFREYLLKPSRIKLLRYELSREDLLIGWRELTVVVTLAKEIRCVRHRTSIVNQLLAIVEKKIKSNCYFSHGEECKRFLDQLPPSALKELQAALSTWSKTLHAEAIDSIIRPRIYHHDLPLKFLVQYILDYRTNKIVSTVE